MISSEGLSLRWTGPAALVAKLIFAKRQSEKRYTPMHGTSFQKGIPLAQPNAFHRRDARQQRRSFAGWDPRLRCSFNSRRPALFLTGLCDTLRVRDQPTHWLQIRRAAFRSRNFEGGRQWTGVDRCCLQRAGCCGGNLLSQSLYQNRR